jgi:membrane protein
MRLSPANRALPAHLLQAVNNFKDYGMRNAAALAYYGVFSLFPLTLLLAVGISTILGPTVAQEQITAALILFLPEETETINLIQDSIEQALQQSRPFGLLALLGLTWSALGLFSNLSSSLDRIFQVPASRSLWHQRFMAFLMTLALIALVIMSFITSGLLRLVDALLLSNPGIWIRIGTLFLPLGLNMVIFVLLFRYVPARFVNWDAVWPAAILGALVLELAKSGFAWYLTNLADFQFVYGGIATVIVLMLWSFLTACIFLFCAELCAQLNLWFSGPDDEPRPVINVLEPELSQLPREIPPPV